MTTVPTPMCYSCAHRGMGLVCTAYPDGIPDEIAASDVDHRLPYAGDNGIVFKQKHGVPAPPWDMLGLD